MTTGEQPQTRRQARERERSQQDATTNPLSRRAVAPETTTAGEAPQVVTSFDSVLASRPPVQQYAASGASAPTAPAAPTAVSTTEPPREQQTDAPDFGVSLRPRTPAPAAPTPSAAAPADPDDIPERTLTRRELRAMLAAQEAEAAASAPVEAPVIASAPAAAEAEPVVADAGRRVTWEPVVSEDTDPRPVWTATPQEQAPIAAAIPPAAPAPVVVSSPAPLAEVFDTADRALTSDVAAPKPVGHWSIDAELDETDTGAVETFDQLLSRGVSSGGVPTTTNALILPTIPQSNGGPVSLNTGEIMVTGSFDLPRSLGSTGALPDRIDSSEIDRLFEMDDAEPTTGAQPIRASRAVSTHASTREVITPPKKESRWTVPFILSLSAAVLAVGVVALVVAGFVSGIF